MENLIFEIIKIIYLILPAGIGNMAPIFMKNYFNRLAFPLDFDKRLNGKPILGRNKTFRGLIFGVIFSIAIVFIQKIAYETDFFKNISLIDYSGSNFIILGFLFGFGSLFGDSVKSFIKRQCGVEPGKPFFPWDQIDWVIGFILFVSFVYTFSFWLIIKILILSLISHLLVRTIGYQIKVNKERW